MWTLIRTNNSLFDKDADLFHELYVNTFKLLAEKPHMNSSFQSLFMFRSVVVSRILFGHNLMKCLLYS